MKILVLLFCLAFSIESASAVAALPPAIGTNDLAAMCMANNANMAWQRYYFVCGKVDRLEREVNRLENGFMILAVLLASTGAAVCLLTTRDRICEWRFGRAKITEKISQVQKP